MIQSNIIITSINKCRIWANGAFAVVAAVAAVAVVTTVAAVAAVAAVTTVAAVATIVTYAAVAAEMDGPTGHKAREIITASFVHTFIELKL